VSDFSQHQVHARKEDETTAASSARRFREAGLETAEKFWIPAEKLARPETRERKCS